VPHGGRRSRLITPRRRTNAPSGTYQEGAARFAAGFSSGALPAPTQCSVRPEHGISGHRWLGGEELVAVVTTTMTALPLRARVLVIDPDVPYLNRMARTLLEAGHEPRRANSVSHGLAKTHGWTPDVVIIDRLVCELERGGLDRLRSLMGPSASERLIVTNIAREPVAVVSLVSEVHRRLSSLS